MFVAWYIRQHTKEKIAESENLNELVSEAKDWLVKNSPEGKIRNERCNKPNVFARPGDVLLDKA